MTSDIAARADLRPTLYDARDYALMVTVRADTGAVEIQHQTGSDAVADRQMARLAAQIIEQVGPVLVAEQLGADEVNARDLAPNAITPPQRGAFVLACRCGRALHLADDMHRKQRRPTQDQAVIQPIVCAECAG